MLIKGNILGKMSVFNIKKYIRLWQIHTLWRCRTSLVVQWLGVCLPEEGMQFLSLVREDSTCQGPAKTVHHNYLACVLRALEPMSLWATELEGHNYWSPLALEPLFWNKRSHCNEKPVHCNLGSSPCSLQPEKAPSTVTQNQCSQK